MTAIRPTMEKEVFEDWRWEPPTNLYSYQLPKDLSKYFGKVYKALSPFLTEQRLQKFKTIAQKRDTQTMIVLEDTYHSHNISAVLRSADAFGFQNITFILSSESPLNYRKDDNVSLGSGSWLCIQKTNNITEYAQKLKSLGYVIGLVSLPHFVTTGNFYNSSLPSYSSTQFDSLDFYHTVGSSPIALIFGSEKQGVSDKWLPFVNFYTHVEMIGFVESLNVSVCAAIMMESLKKQKNNPLQLNIKPSPQNIRMLQEYWIAKNLEKAFDIIHSKHPEIEKYFNFIRQGYFFKNSQTK